MVRPRRPLTPLTIAFYVEGSFATASCTRCKYQVKADDIREDIFAQKIPLCPKCRVNALPPILDINPNESYGGNSKYLEYLYICNGLDYGFLWYRTH